MKLFTFGKRLLLAAFFCVIAASGAWAQNDSIAVRFGNVQLPCGGGSMLVTVQVRAANATPFELGNSSFVFRFNENALGLPTLVQSLNFNETNACNAGVAPYGPQQFTSAITAFGGQANLGVVLNSTGNGCPTVTNAGWTDVAVLSFPLVNPTLPPNVQWQFPQTGFLDDDNGSNPTGDPNGDVIPVSSATDLMTFPPLITATAAPATVCSGAPVTLSASDVANFDSFVWQPGNLSGAAVSINPINTTTFTVTGSRGCDALTATAAVTVTVNGGSAIDLSGATAFCTGGSTTFTINNFAALSNVQLSFNGGAAAPVGASFNVNVGGNYTLTADPVNGCPTLLNFVVTENALPAASINGGLANLSYCAGGSVTLTATPGGLPAGSYVWSGGFSGSGESVTFSPVGNQVVNLTITNANGCTGVASININETAAPVVNVTPNPAAFCPGGSVVLTATSDNPADQISWDGGVTFSSTLTVNAPGDYTVTVTRAGGCVTQVTRNVTQSPVAAISLSSASGFNGFCTGGSVILQATAGLTNYIWNDGFNGGASNTRVVNVAGSYSVSATDPITGCASGVSNSITVVENPLPTASITGGTVSCAGVAIPLTVQIQDPSYTVLWTPNGETTTTIQALPGFTYTVTVTNPAVGCASLPVSHTVNVGAGITPTLLGATSICAGQSTSLSVVENLTNMQLSFNGGAAVSVVSPFIVSNAGNYTLTADPIGGCPILPLNFTITTNTPPAPVITGTLGAFVCPNTTTTLSVGNYASYLWTNVPAANSTDATVNVAAGTYGVTVTDANGCTAQASFTVNPPLQVSAGANQTINAGSTVVLGGAPTASAGAGSYSYQWAPIAGLTSATTSNPTAAPSGTTTYTVFVTDGVGCTASATVLVIVIPPSQPDPLTVTAFTSATQTICSGETTQLGSTPVGGTAPYTYQWAPALNTGQEQVKNPSVTTYNTTTYTVTVTDAALQTATATVTVTVRPMPILDAGANQTLCIGSGVVLGGNSVVMGGQGPFSYLWSPAAGLSSATQIKPTANPNVTTTYTLTVTDGNGCSYTDAVTVTVASPGAVQAYTGANKTVCAGQSAQLTGSATGGNGVYFYQWSPATGLTSTNAANPTATPAVSTVYTLTVTDGNGCLATATQSVVVNSAVTVSAGQSQTLCKGSSVQIGQNPVSGVSYSWVPSAGLSNPLVANPVASPAFTTTYTVQASAQGCVSTSTVTLTVSNGPAVNAGPFQTSCGGTPVQIGAGNGAGVTYLWSPSIGLDNASAASPMASPSATTVYTVTATDANGCTATSVTTVNVQPAIVVSVSGNQTICPGQTATLSATATGGSGNLTYAWSPAATLSASNTKNVVANPLETTTYTLTVANANGSACATTATVTVTVSATTAAVLSANNFGPCEGETATLTATANNATSFIWRNNGAVVEGQNGATLNVAASGAYTVEAVYDGACPVAESNVVEVKFRSKPAAPVITRFGTLLQAGNETGTFQWYLNGEIIPGANGKNYNVMQNGVYTVVFTATNGCSAASAEYVFSITELPEWLNESISVYPNPSQAGFQIQLNLNAPQTIKFEVTNALGQTIWSNVEAVNAGLQTVTIPAEKLAVGNYFLRAASGEFNWTTRLVKTN